MKHRCYNVFHPAYDYYGGRGIKICDRWRLSFKNFLADMGEKPEGMQIDRINPEGNYCPENCRWATAKQNMRNRRPNSNARFITANGETKTLAEWAEELGTHSSTIIHRIKRHGWSEKKAVTTPLRKKHKNSKTLKIL